MLEPNPLVNLPDLEQVEWNYDQFIIIDGFFSNGKKNGEWKFYGDDGSLSMVINFINGDVRNKK